MRGRVARLSEADPVRVIFLVALLAGSLFYTYVAFADLNFMTRTGRLGPGFFPRVIGSTLVLFALWALIDALRGADAAEEAPEGTWGDVTVLIALAIGYAVLLRLFGGMVATVIYLAVALTVVNRGRHLQNAILTVLLPLGIYLLFDRLLNANMPPALYELPI